MQRAMRTLLLLSILSFSTGCTAMRTVKGSARTFLTEAGTTIDFERPAADVISGLQQSFADRGFAVLKTTDVTPNNKVIYFRGTRDRINRRRPNDNQQQNFVSQDIGSWFAVRVVSQGTKTTLSFYGKPTVHGVEGCGDGDRELRDAGYQCNNVEKRADWAGHQLVEGREETQVISTIIAQLGERWPQ